MSMIEGMSIVAGLALDGAALTDVHDLAPRHALIGQASFGPMALLRDLELRLGLVDNDASPAVRGARWSSRVMRLAAERFYARSHAVDAWGTALELLRWRDELVLAGWDGAPIESGGERLAALAELEAMAQPSLPPSEGDRLIAIARTLITTPSRVYARLRLVDAIELWPLRWQHVFARLAASGCAIEPYAVESQLALPDSDLGRLQRHDFSQPAMLTGDGSLVLLRADTPWEAAHATAALLRAFDDEDCVVIRGWGAAPLEAALSRQGLPSQGLRVTTTARPLVQLVSLAIELAFEPKDPFRILELLLL
ncbi:MAG TPA: hypothetical protein VHB97_25180, partial [Polyangia bacterium]|nr:hypothetical protein [Polyangia bacterium]